MCDTAQIGWSRAASAFSCTWLNTVSRRSVSTKTTPGRRCMRFCGRPGVIWRVSRIKKPRPPNGYRSPGRVGARVASLHCPILPHVFGLEPVRRPRKGFATLTGRRTHVFSPGALGWGASSLGVWPGFPGWHLAGFWGDLGWRGRLRARPRRKPAGTVGGA